jgi:hypothetical protein
MADSDEATQCHNRQHILPTFTATEVRYSRHEKQNCTFGEGYFFLAMIICAAAFVYPLSKTPIPVAAAAAEFYDGRYP